MASCNLWRAAGSLLPLLLLALAVRHAAAQGCPVGLSIIRISTFKLGNWTGTGSVEVLDYDNITRLLAVVEAGTAVTTPLSVAVINMTNPAAPVLVRRILFGTQFGGNDTTTGRPKSVSVFNGYVAVSLDANVSTNPGWIRIYRMSTGVKVGEVQMTGSVPCPGPDSIKWLRGNRIVVACEGEPSTQNIAGSDPTVGINPTGAVGIVNITFLTRVSATLTYKGISFQPYINSLSVLQYLFLTGRGLRIDPRLTKATAAKDIEPEYIAVNANQTRAWITLQECNGIAVVNLTPGLESITAVWPLGFKNWTSNTLDPSDRNNVSMKTYANLLGLLQPDTIKYFNISGREYIAIANEGDAKEEKIRVKNLPNGLDPVAFPNASLTTDGELGRLNISPLNGVKGGYNTSRAWNAQGPYDKLYTYGARSWAILNATNGAFVYESGSELEFRVRNNSDAVRCFNCDRDANDFDSRSDDSGPEPEALEVFSVYGKHYIAVGLERMGGFMVYDITNVNSPVYGGYYSTRNFTAPASTPTSQLGDLAPESIQFVPAAESPNGAPLLIVSNEISGSITTWRVDPCVVSPGRRRLLAEANK